MKRQLNIKVLQRFLALSTDDKAPEYMRQVDCTEHLQELNAKFRAIDKLVKRSMIIVS